MLDGDNFEPWHWITLPTTLLTIFLFFRFNALRTRRDAGEIFDYDHWTMRGTVHLNRARNALSLCWMALAVYGFVALSHLGCKLPPWTAPLLAWRFGAVPASCAF